ncbi:hypothetical protein CBM2634_U420004 [Cupriavidus taiwanensis]|uniref:Uncharacterized protein n=1 Tax=Cupriavidus taiwanensis TaxID=164546 RepID=A0A375JD81_9BURK|nr:hypothetical protein CBM2634_U420004 [Cupriavidus taiwanensis]
MPIDKQRAWGQRIQARRPVKTRELKGATRTLELVLFLRVTLLELTDSLLPTRTPRFRSGSARLQQDHNETGSLCS